MGDTVSFTDGVGWPLPFSMQSHHLADSGLVCNKSSALDLPLEGGGGVDRGSIGFRPGHVEERFERGRPVRRPNLASLAGA